MMIFVIAALALAAPAALGAYFRLARRSILRAGKAWHLFEQHAHVLMEDRRLDPAIGDLVEIVIQHVGDGKLTGTLIWSLLVGKRKSTQGNFNVSLNKMNDHQVDQFLHFLVAALFYDSLRTPLRGAVLRRLIYWLAATANDKTAPVSIVQVEPVMSAAGRLCPTG